MCRLLRTAVLVVLMVGAVACSTGKDVAIKLNPSTATAQQPMRPTPVGKLERTIYFKFDDDQISPYQVPKLDNNVDWLKNNPWAYIVLEGYCDDVGDEDYNMELGDRRARAVKAYLYEHGVDPSRVIVVVSYGESRPAVAGYTFEARQRNRRVEFKIR